MSINYHIHTGSSLLNLALTGNAQKGWPTGRVSNVIGDKSTGKTLLAIEAASNCLLLSPEGTKPKVYYAEAEAAFDQPYAANLGMPVDLVNFEAVTTVEDFYESLRNACSQATSKQPTLYILDSLDAITSKAEMDRDIDESTYGGEKQKKIGETFRKLVKPMEDANLHLFIISQIRENISTIPFAPKYRRSGGKALDFYASHLVWLAETGKLKNTKTKMTYGLNIQANITKNKVAAQYRKVEFPLIFQFGVDEIYSLMKFMSNTLLPTNLRLKKETGGYFVWQGVRAQINEFVTVIEEEPQLYKALVAQAQLAWDWFEETSRITRKSKIELFKGTATVKELEESETTEESEETDQTTTTEIQENTGSKFSIRRRK